MDASFGYLWTWHLLTACVDRYIESTREVHDVNSMLWTFVVDHELKKLNARKRVPKGLSCRSNFPQQMENEFDDE